MAIAVVVLVASPLAGRPQVVRLPAVLVPVIGATLLLVRPWKYSDLSAFALGWQPSRRFIASAAVVVFVLLFWYVLTRFYSGEINAVDFTVYYDRPCFQTVHGRPLFVEVSDSPGYSYRSELGDHAYWGMLGICSAYALYASPLWLHTLSVVAVVTGALGVLRVLQRRHVGGVLACGAALAFVLNDNTARTLNYGFHPEVLYAALVPWAIHAGLVAARLRFCLLVVGCVLVKEDAIFPLLGVSITLALHRFRHMTAPERIVFLVAPVVAGIANLALYYSAVIPLLRATTVPTYAHFWSNYGDTPVRALSAMLRHPHRVLSGTLSSGIYTVLRPYLFLPLVGWRWAIGMLPLVLLYGASANAQVRTFGIYYAIVLVPFLTLAAASGALTIVRRMTADVGQAQSWGAALVVTSTLLVGGGYSLRPWRTAVSGVPHAVATLGDERIVLVQSGLFPHAGYDQRLQLLTPETLHDPRNKGAAILLAPGIGGYPFRPSEIRAMAELRPISVFRGGLVAVRRPEQ